MTAVAESESDSESEDDELVNLQGDTGIIDALTAPKGECTERLWISAEEMNWQMDQFSRKFDITNYNNAMTIAGKLGEKPPAVHTWELVDKAFSFPRVRRFQDVQDNIDMIEHFQDNLNTNISNQKLVQNFIRVGKSAVAELAAKYHDGEFANPADSDPRNPAPITWANTPNY